MATKHPIHAGFSSHQARGTSPFFSLPNEDGSNPYPPRDPEQSQQYPPITLSCASCERIVGDSSAFLYATRQMGSITLDQMVSVTFGQGGLKTSTEGKWDEFCNYKDITCGKCSTALGKMYFATTSKLSALQKKYTLDITALSFYHHASHAPSLPVAATSEIYAQLHPSPEALAGDIDNVMTICVMLRDEQENIIRELKKLGQVTGVEIDLEDGGTSGEGLDAKENWRERAKVLDEVMGTVKALERKVGELGKKLREEDRPENGKMAIHQERGTLVGEGVFLHKEDQQPQEKTQQDTAMSDAAPPPLGPRRQEKKTQNAPPPAAANKKKRKSSIENVTTTTASKQVVYIDLSNVQVQDGGSSSTQHVQPEHKRKPEKEVSDSQSVGEAEKGRGINHDGDSECREEQGEGGQEGEDEETEDQVKSPAEKRRKAVVAAGNRRDIIAGRRVSQGRKGK